MFPIIPWMELCQKVSLAQYNLKMAVDVPVNDSLDTMQAE